MRVVFVGTVHISKVLLLKVINSNVDVVGICTLSSSSFHSDHCDLSPIANSYKIPLFDAKNINSIDTFKWIKDKKPDIIFCFGWSQLIKKNILNLPPLGVVGFHPALLPQNRGRHPIIS